MVRHGVIKVEEIKFSHTPTHPALDGHNYGQYIPVSKERLCMCGLHWSLKIDSLELNGKMYLWKNKTQRLRG
jgi:hypothetical protein